MKRLLRWPVVIWMLLLVLAVLLIVRTPIAADMSAFLPRSAASGQQILVDQLREGVGSRLFLVAIENAAPDVLAKLSHRMAADLLAQQGIVLVGNGDISMLTRDRDYLWSNRYLLSPAISAEHFSVQSLHAALESDIALLGSQLGMIMKQSLPHDPTGEILQLTDLMRGDAKPAMRDGVWFSSDFKRAILMVQSAAAGFDIDGQEAVNAKIRVAFEAARSTNVQAADARLTVTGPPVFATNSRAQIKGDATLYSGIASAVIASVLLLAYRAPRILFLAMVPVASGALAGIATVGLVFGTVHGITLGFGVALIGEAIDYSIYLFSRISPAQSTRETLVRLWPTLRLGLLTSIVGFSAMLFSGFTGFKQLGLFVMMGLVSAALVTRHVLPHFLPDGFAGVRATGFGEAFRRLAARAPKLRPALAFVVVAALATLVLHQGRFWEGELQSMNPVPRLDQERDRDLRRDLGAPDVRYIAIASVSDEDAALALSEKLDASLHDLVSKGALSGFDAPSRYLPSLATQQARQNALPADDRLRASLAQAVQGLPFKPDLFEPFLNDVASARTQALLTRESLNGTTLALKVDALLLRRSGTVAALLPLRGVEDFEAIQNEIGKGAVLVLDLKRESDTLLSSYLREAQTLALTGSVAILALLGAALRSPRRVFTVALPLAAAVIVTTAILLVSGHKLSIFNLFGLLLVVAIGSNYTLFFETEDLGATGGERVIASLVLANLCTVFAFAILSFSDIPVMKGIGMTVSIGAFLSLIFGAIVTAHGFAERR